jgi:hypothetical protein
VVLFAETRVLTPSPTHPRTPAQITCAKCGGHLGEFSLEWGWDGAAQRRLSSRPLTPNTLTPHPTPLTHRPRLRGRAHDAHQHPALRQLAVHQVQAGQLRKEMGWGCESAFSFFPSFRLFFQQPSRRLSLSFSWRRGEFQRDGDFPVGLRRACVCVCKECVNVRARLSFFLFHALGVKDGQREGWRRRARPRPSVLLSSRGGGGAHRGPVRAHTQTTLFLFRYRPSAAPRSHGRPAMVRPQNGEWARSAAPAAPPPHFLGHGERNDGR